MWNNLHNLNGAFFTFNVKNMEFHNNTQYFSRIQIVFYTSGTNERPRHPRLNREEDWVKMSEYTSIEFERTPKYQMWHEFYVITYGRVTATLLSNRESLASHFNYYMCVNGVGVIVVSLSKYKLWSSHFHSISVNCAKSKYGRFCDMRIFNNFNRYLIHTNKSM